MTSQQFIAAVMQIAAERPTYRTGGSGTDGTCDCIGLVMGAINRVQRIAYPLHSTNYFSRWEMATLESTEDAAIMPGMLVYKARRDMGDLNARYKDGGRYYNSDLRDYYHVGVVCGVSPLLIVHCTSGGGVDGITTDGSLAGWTHAGKPLNVEFAEDVINMDETTPAVVATPDGNPVKLRPTPSTEQAYIAKIPNGDTVQLFADAQGWAKVVWKGLVGYCMSEFLQYDRPQETEPIPTWAMLMMDKLDQIIHLLGGGSVG